MTVNDSLRSLMINELMSDSLKFFWLKSYFFNKFYIHFFILKNERFAHSLLLSNVSESLRSSQKMSDVSKSLRSLTKMSDHERFAQVAHQK